MHPYPTFLVHPPAPRVVPEAQCGGNLLHRDRGPVPVLRPCPLSEDVCILEPGKSMFSIGQDERCGWFVRDFVLMCKRSFSYLHQFLGLCPLRFLTFPLGLNQLPRKPVSLATMFILKSICPSIFVEQSVSVFFLYGSLRAVGRQGHTFFESYDSRCSYLFHNLVGPCVLE